MFEHILVPIDGSDDGWIALDQAIELAKEENGSIHGLFVADMRLVEAPYFIAMYAYSPMPSFDPTMAQVAMEASKRLKERGDQILAQLADRCRQAGVPCQTEQAEGVISWIILDRARQADLIVLGRHGEGAHWAGPLLGSTFEAVVRHAPVPVLATQAEARPITRILIAFDGSNRARDALDVAAHLAAERNRSIVLLTVDDGHPGREQAHRLGEDLLRERGVPADPLFWKGHPAEEILRAARVENCDLIVMGAYGHSRFLEVFFGSTVDEVMRGATTPLLICR